MYYFNGSEQTFTWLGRQLESVTNSNGNYTFDNQNALSAAESILIDIPETKTVDKFEGFIKSFLPDGAEPFKTSKQIKIFGKAKTFSSKTPWGLAIESVVKIGRGVFDGVFYME